MKITVFGATGQIGRLLVKQALDEGYQVVAYARDGSKLESLKNPQLTIVEGELNNPQHIEEAILGSDAVLSMMGPAMTNKISDMPVAEGTQNIVNAMKKLGVKRLIAIGTPSSIPDPKNDQPTLFINTIRETVKHTMANAFYEFDRIGDIIQKSGLDWTIVRFLQPTDDPKVGIVKHGFVGKTRLGMKTTRADIADFSLKQVTDKTYIGKMPAISN
jgi:putative NADH-flavin reductase